MAGTFSGTTEGLETRLEHLTKGTGEKLSCIALLAVLFAGKVVAETQHTSAASPEKFVLFAAVFLPFIAAALVPVVYRLIGEKTAYYSAFVAALGLSMVLMLYGTNGAVSIPWIPTLGVNLSFYVDGLSVLIGLLATGIGVLILSYSGGYMHGEPYQPKFYASLLAFMGSMLGVAFAGDLILLFVFWELTSISSFMLIGHYQNQASKYAARKSMLITVGGGLFMLVSFLMISSVTGTFSIPELLSHPEIIQQELRTAGLFLPVLGTLIVGAAAKSAQVPLHIWLPNAMEAPTPVSAFLHSATMVKAGVYILARFRPVMVGGEWMAVLVPLGMLTMLIAGILAVASTDIKELLAYSTASHLGLIVAALGFVSGIGAEAAGFHILNHALFKASLFLVAGIVAHEAGTRAIGKLGGLKESLPYTAAITVIAGLAMGGVPPFNGFQSKELLFEASWHTASHLGGITWLAPVVAVLGSVFTFVYSIKFISLFFGDKPDSLGHIHKPPLTMLLPPLVLMTGVLLVTIFPQTAIDTVVQSAVKAASLETPHMHASLIPHLSPAFGMSLITIVLGLGAFRYYSIIHSSVNSFLTSYPYFKSNWWYDNGLEFIRTLSRKTADAIHHEHLRGYLYTGLAAVCVLGLSAYLAASISLPALGFNLPVTMLLVLGVAVVGASAVILSDSHISGVLTLSILGAMVAIFYVLARAPDLALTQLVIETLALVMFILVLDKLPDYYGSIPASRKIKDTTISALVGATVAVTVLVSTAANPDKISEYFVKNALEKGGGSNIVNVILVDFRGFDTMGEITVISMAALAVVTFIAMRDDYPWFRRNLKDRFKRGEEE